MAKVLMVTHWDWVLYNFRLPLAKALQQHGYEVVFVCPFGEYVPRLQEAGFRCVHWSLHRQSLNPLQELLAIRRLTLIYRDEQPDFVHHFTIKPNLYGSLAVRLMRYGTRDKDPRKGKPIVINTFEGLGFLFSSHSKARLLRVGVLPLLRLALRSPNTCTIFLSRQDHKTFIHLGLVSSTQSVVIPSIGVDTQRFSPYGYSMLNLNLHTPIPSPIPPSPVVLMACRLLWDKGVGEFVEATRQLHQKGVTARFWLAGTPDKGNPACVPETALAEWQREGLISWLGHRNDMPELLRQVDIAVLPSYYPEGVPRFLLEAAATGLPLVATDIEGCRMVVRDGENGFLVPPKDSKSLAEAIETLLRNPSLREQMGQSSRVLAESEFEEKKIIAQYLTLYQQLRVFR